MGNNVMNETDLKLYGVCLGGRAEGCNIELHDVVFVVGSNIYNTFSQLQEKWFGIPNRLHIDSYIELNEVNGFRISLSKNKPSDNPYHLYFVNYGAYSPGSFQESHDMAFIVSHDKAEPRKFARENLCLGLEQRHLDDHIKITDQIDRTTPYLVDDIMEISMVDGYYLHIEKCDNAILPQANAGYIKIPLNVTANIEKANE